MCHFWRKTIKKCDCKSVDYTQGQRQTEFINCPMLYSIAMGQIIIVLSYYCSKLEKTVTSTWLLRFSEWNMPAVAELGFMLLWIMNRSIHSEP